MQEQIDACNAIMIYGVHGWSFQSFSFIKSWVQNQVSTHTQKMERGRSVEECDTLERSTKKFKDHHILNEGIHEANENGKNLFRSYKDKLVRDIPGAYEQAFGFDANMDEEAESDAEEDNLCERMVAISLSKEEKTRIRVP